MKPWTKIETIETHDFLFFKIFRDTVNSPGSQEREYSWIKMKRPFVTIIPISKDGKIWMVKQHRYPLGKFVIELPGGVVDPGEDPLQAAKRELEEEIGLTSENWTRLGPIEEVGVSAEAKGTVFLARDTEETPEPRRDPLDQDLFEVIQFPERAIEDMVRNNEIRDTATIAALWLCKLNMTR